MSKTTGKSLAGAVKGKMAIAFLLVGVAVVLTWSAGRDAFRQMLQTMEVLSAPNDKLRLVNTLFQDITRLDQLQRAQALQGKSKSYTPFLKESEQLRITLDSLQLLCRDNPWQTSQIDSMKNLLQKRDKLFLDYMKVREGLINSRMFSDQIKMLSELIVSNAELTDTTVVTTRKTISTTTVLPGDSNQQKEPEQKGFLSGIFGKKKPKEPAPQPTRKVIAEATDITIDTLTLASQDSTLQEAILLLRQIKKEQRRRSKQFVTREAQLASAGNVLTSKMLNVLQGVEKEVMRQVEQNNRNAQLVVNSSIERIGLILVGLLVILALLLYFILTDIAKGNAYRRQLEAAKEEAEYHSRAKQRFLSNMSHEIRTPLQSIIGYSELVRDQKKPQKEHLEAIYQSSEHLLHIVNEVLDYSRIISGNFAFDHKPFCLPQLLREVENTMRAQAGNKGILLTVRNQINISQNLCGDPFRLKQILYNLLGNAIKFTDTGSVTLSVSGDFTGANYQLNFEVKDTGCGIAEEDLARIFQEFEQSGEISEKTLAGTGLGLSIVKALAENQGGKVTVSSSIGEGACFTVQLGFAVSENTESTSAQQSQLRLQRPFFGEVWVADDDRLILQLCSSFLSKYGVKHRCFGSAEELLAAGSNQDVSLFLLDMRMPGMSGVELCEQLRAQKAATAKIYALTAQALPEEREEVLNHGFDGLLMKPFREAGLLAVLNDNCPAAPAFSPPADCLDLSSLEKMTYGDKDLIVSVLEQFIEDARHDLQALKAAALQPNPELVCLLAHRMAQVGTGELAAQFRRAEIAWRGREVTTEEYQADLILLEAGTEDLLKLVEEKVAGEFAMPAEHS